MKKTVLSLSMAFFLIGCQEESVVSSVEETQGALKTKGQSTYSTLEELKAPVEEKNAYDLAKLLHNSMDSNFISKLQSKSKQRFDGDYDVLVAEAFSNDVRYRSADAGNLSDLISEKTKASQVISSILEKDPLLNIYMPDWGDLSKIDDYLIVILPKGMSDKEEYFVDAINSKGEIVKLSSKHEPKIPYLVIGHNERVVVSNSNTRSHKDNSDIIYQTKHYSYSLKKGLINFQTKNDRISEVEKATYSTGKKRKFLLGLDNIETIKWAEFTSLNAIKEVEAWTKGQPEVVCKISYKKLGTSLIRKIFTDYEMEDLDLGENDWYSGSNWWNGLGLSKMKLKRKHGNWTSIKWVRKALITVPITYHFIEDDSLGGVSMKLLGKKIVLELDGDGDDIGRFDVHFSDYLDREYTTNSGRFRVFMTQTKD